MSKDAINQIVKSLHEGNLKQTLSLIKELQKTHSFRNEWKSKAWDGWVSSLERDVDSSLLYRMISGIDDSELAAVLKYFCEMRKKLAEKDPSMKQLTTGFFGEWIRLIRAYRKLDKKKSEK